jgi:hypothetical protein
MWWTSESVFGSKAKIPFRRLCAEILAFEPGSEAVAWSHFF